MSDYTSLLYMNVIICLCPNHDVGLAVALQKLMGLDGKSRKLGEPFYEWVSKQSLWFVSMRPNSLRPRKFDVNLWPLLSAWFIFNSNIDK